MMCEGNAQGLRDAKGESETINTPKKQYDIQRPTGETEKDGTRDELESSSSVRQNSGGKLGKPVKLRDVKSSTTEAIKGDQENTLARVNTVS
jgi:hypothetical protein